jgi:hypothetical protein
MRLRWCCSDQAVHEPRPRRHHNELYANPKTGRFFVDAKSGVTQLIASVKTLVA